MSKLFVVFVVCAVVAVKETQGNIPKRIKEIMAPVHNDCVVKHSIPDSFLERARNGDFANEENFKCYLKCLYDGFEIIRANHTFDIETALKVIPEDLRHLYEETAYKCDTIHGSDLCDTAYKTTVCNYENNKENFFFI